MSNLFVRMVKKLKSASLRATTKKITQRAAAYNHLQPLR